MFSSVLHAKVVKELFLCDPSAGPKWSSRSEDKQKRIYYNGCKKEGEESCEEDHQEAEVLEADLSYRHFRKPALLRGRFSFGVARAPSFLRLERL